LSEKHPPETIINFINEFLSELIEIAMDKDGTVERFLGDAVMVIWGAPVEQANHAALACEAAVRMREAIDRVADTESERLGARVHARIGVNSGSMTAGNVGANKRFNYTVLGDCVNLAARLEGLNKVYQTTLLIGSATAAEIDDAFVVREIDTVTVKGRQQPETVFEILGMANEVPDTKLEAASAYAKGREAYRRRDWEKATQHFAAGLEADASDGPCAAMLSRCNRYRANPPPEDWTGVYNVDTK
jgi:adenylate cyclase